QLPELRAHRRVPLLLRHDQGAAADGPLRQMRGRRRLLSRRLRLPRGRQHLRHDVGDREVLERHDDELRAECLHAVRRVPRGLQRRERPARRAVLRAAALGGRRQPRDLRHQELRQADQGADSEADRGARRRRQPDARSDLQEDRCTGVHEAAGLARRRDVLPHRHRGPEQHRPEEDRQDRRPRQAVTQASFGRLPDGTDVGLFTLSNARGLEVRAIEYGAILVSVRAPDRRGQLDDVVLGCDDLEGYLTRSRYFGAVVGRYGNRIANGRFTLDGRTFQLATNNAPNHLHGGVKGFDKVVWRAQPYARDGHTAVASSYTSPDGEET